MYDIFGGGGEGITEKGFFVKRFLCIKIMVKVQKGFQ